MTHRGIGDVDLEADSGPRSSWDVAGPSDVAEDLQLLGGVEHDRDMFTDLRSQKLPQRSAISCRISNDDVLNPVRAASHRVSGSENARTPEYHGLVKAASRAPGIRSDLDAIRIVVPAARTDIAAASAWKSSKSSSATVRVPSPASVRARRYS